MGNYIEIKDVHKSFTTNDETCDVLKGVNLSVREGEIFGVVGLSGAGKSTLARCINGLEKPDRGSIVVGGTEILSLSKTELRKERRKIGMVFQTFNLFDSKTVYQNIAFPLEINGASKKQVQERVTDVADFVGLASKLREYPGGLSGGQKQRVGIARALAGKPDVLLSDEATSALDPQTTLQILDLLKEINSETGITILMITHELDAIKYSCRRVAVLEEGRVAENGYVDDVFYDPQSKTGSLFAKVYREMQQTEIVSDGAGI